MAFLKFIPEKLEYENPLSSYNVKIKYIYYKVYLKSSSVNVLLFSSAVDIYLAPSTPILLELI